MAGQRKSRHPHDHYVTLYNNDRGLHQPVTQQRQSETPTTTTIQPNYNAHITPTPTTRTAPQQSYRRGTYNTSRRSCRTIVTFDPPLPDNKDDGSIKERLTTTTTIEVVSAMERKHTEEIRNLRETIMKQEADWQKQMMQREQDMLQREQDHKNERQKLLDIIHQERQERRDQMVQEEIKRRELINEYETKQMKENQMWEQKLLEQRDAAQAKERQMVQEGRDQRQRDAQQLSQERAAHHKTRMTLQSVNFELLKLKLEHIAVILSKIPLSSPQTLQQPPPTPMIEVAVTESWSSAQRYITTEFEVSEDGDDDEEDEDEKCGDGATNDDLDAIDD